MADPRREQLVERIATLRREANEAERAAARLHAHDATAEQRKRAAKAKEEATLKGLEVLRLQVELRRLDAPASEPFDPRTGEKDEAKTVASLAEKADVIEGTPSNVAALRSSLATKLEASSPALPVPTTTPQEGDPVVPPVSPPTAPPPRASMSRPPVPPTSTRRWRGN